MTQVRRILFAFAVATASLTVGHVASAAAPSCPGWFFGIRSSTETLPVVQDFPNGDTLSFELDYTWSENLFDPAVYKFGTQTAVAGQYGSISGFATVDFAPGCTIPAAGGLKITFMWAIVTDTRTGQRATTVYEQELPPTGC